MSVFTSEMTGTPELLNRLEGMGNYAHVRKVMLKAIAPGATKVRAAVRSEVPPDSPANKPESHKPGDLRKSVRYKASRKSTGVIAYMIGAFGKGSAHRHLVIYGHQMAGHAHTVAGRKVSLKLGRQANRGGRTKANDFVGRGEQKSRTQAFDAIAAKSKELIDELGTP